MNIDFSYLFVCYSIMFIFVHWMPKNNGSIILRFAFCYCVFVKIVDIVWNCERYSRHACHCHPSTISSADFLGQLNHAHKSWPTLLIVWHPLYCSDCRKSYIVVFKTNLSLSVFAMLWHICLLRGHLVRSRNCGRSIPIYCRIE